MARETFQLGNCNIKPGARATIELPIAALYTQTGLEMPVTVVHGKRSGPVMLVCAAIHGDEINGVEIIRRLLRSPSLKRLRGTLIAVPVVNVYGFINRSRYLPDRRDLNRFFPGTMEGSMTSRLAGLFMREIVKRCTHAIDLHTGAVHRPNFPQIRANLTHETVSMMAKAFGPPVILNSELLDGSLRKAAIQDNVPMIVYEAGEAMRFDEPSIRFGVRGIIKVMRALEMLPPIKNKRTELSPWIVTSSTWVRAPKSGILLSQAKAGAQVKTGDKIGGIAEPFGSNIVDIKATDDGVILGLANIPLVNEGEALYHIGVSDKKESSTDALDAFHEQLDNIPSPSSFYDVNPPESKPGE